MQDYKAPGSGRNLKALEGLLKTDRTGWGVKRWGLKVEEAEGALE